MGGKEDRSKIWLAISTTTEIAMAITLNKYSAALSGWAVLLIWIIPSALLVVWAIKEEKSKAFVDHFKQTPISYCLLLAICIPLTVYTTRVMWGAISKASTLAQRAAVLQSPLPSPKDQVPAVPRTQQLTIPEPHTAGMNNRRVRRLSSDKNPLSKSAAPLVQEAPPIVPPVVPIPGGQVQTMTNSPGGMQAGRDLYAFGRLPAPDRVLQATDIQVAASVLEGTGGSEKGSVEIITFPTDVSPQSEIYRFANQLQQFFSAHGWSVYRNTEIQVRMWNGSTEAHFGPHGVGCSIPPRLTNAAQTAMQALKLLRYPCVGNSMIDGYTDNNRFSLYITVGTRLIQDQ